ncbi:hypothetical protein KP509_26G016200 [Ceratopteris richardii]|uniref:Protein kinase domain-containing protein n=1 Tax=Ceratopteris richardii TaxID=49495 RepID=A0A8T2RIE1_CERRI|nr:hypothetical protein KP509_26G016200 [Ceratopteris richardii]
METSMRMQVLLVAVVATLLPMIWNFVVEGGSLILDTPRVLAQTDTVPIVSSEAAALLNLRGTLGIRSSYWPRKSDPCQAWVGITCHRGHVISITLSNLRRTYTGALNPSFALDPIQALSNLATLNTSGFPLPGVIPNWFGSLSALEHLDLSSCSISSSLPYSLGSLINLQSLAMANNNLTGLIPSSFGSMASLTSLDLSNNRLSGSIPGSIFKLQYLVSLNLGGNQLVGQISSGVASLLKLQFLQLSNNALQGPMPSELGNFSSLIILDLGFNNLSGPIPKSIGELSSLLHLRLSGNSLNSEIPEQLSNCIHLRSLSLDQNALTGNLPRVLGSLTNLSTVSLSFNNLTGVLPTELGNLAQIQYLHLAGNFFYGTIPLVFANLTKLTALDFSKNYFEGIPPTLTGSKANFTENCLTDTPSQRTSSTCREFYLSKGILFQGVIEAPAPLLPISDDSVKKPNHLAPILGGVFGGLGFVILVMMLMFYMLKRRSKGKLEEDEMNSRVQKTTTRAFSGNISVNLLCLGESFSYAQLQQASRDFSDANLLKVGHSGDLYEGLLEGHARVVIKRMNLVKMGKANYPSELDLFGKASHIRLVPLLGHCLEREDEKLLVYKFMPGRDLSHALQKRSNRSSAGDGIQTLDWITRLKIAIGAAEGLTYLHHECSPAFVHRDIQASSILLDDKYEVRIGSLSEACIATGDTHQRTFSRMLRKSRSLEHGEVGSTVATRAYDVYCFGKVLLELVSGKLGISGSKDPSTDAWLEWALSFINLNEKESIGKIMDPTLVVDEDLMDEVWAISVVAKSCLNPKPNKRPLMRYVLKALENPLKVVREDATAANSGRARTSSHGSWNGAFLGSWHHSSAETVPIPGSLREEYMQKNKPTKSGVSQRSGGFMESSLSHRRLGSSEIFPEPVEDNIPQEFIDKELHKGSG